MTPTPPCMDKTSELFPVTVTIDADRSGQVQLMFTKPTNGGLKEPDMEIVFRFSCENETLKFVHSPADEEWMLERSMAEIASKVNGRGHLKVGQHLPIILLLFPICFRFVPFFQLLEEFSKHCQDVWSG